MLTDTRCTTVVSSLGWVDHGGLWVWDIVRERPVPHALSGAKFLSLHAGTWDHFAAVHHFGGERVEITVHRFAVPEDVVARAEVRPDGFRLDGDLAAWENVPTSYVADLADASWNDYALLRVRPRHERVEVQRFDWYNDDYDKLYQGILDVVPVPRQETLAVSVQRDSRLVLHDPVARKKVGSVALAGRGGNPRLRFGRGGQDAWATDYDTVLRLDPATWRVEKSRRLQGAFDGGQKFIGDFWFDAGETLCVVPRPFSGDVVGLDPRSLRPRFRCRLDGQPIEAVALPDRTVIARDWQTGNLLRGVWKRAWFA